MSTALHNTRSVTLNLWTTLHSWQTVLRRQQIWWQHLKECSATLVWTWMSQNKVCGWKCGAWIHSKSFWEIHQKSWELQLFESKDRKYQRRHPSTESTGLGSMSQASNSVDIWPWQKHQDQALHSHGWIGVTLWCWNMDDDKDADQGNRYCLYKDASDGSGYHLEEAHDKWGVIQRPAQSQFQNWH